VFASPSPNQSAVFKGGHNARQLVGLGERMIGVVLFSGSMPATRAAIMGFSPCS
jgi:hypothetical protein